MSREFFKENRGGSYTDFPRWIKNKTPTITLKVSARLERGFTKKEANFLPISVILISRDGKELFSSNSDVSLMMQ